MIFNNQSLINSELFDHQHLLFFYPCQLTVQKKTGHRTALHHQSLFLQSIFDKFGLTHHLPTSLYLILPFATYLSSYVLVAFKIFIDCSCVFFEPFLCDVPKSLYVSLFIIFPTVSCYSAVVVIIFSQPKGKDGVFSPQQLYLA